MTHEDLADDFAGGTGVSVAAASEVGTFRAAAGP